MVLEHCLNAALLSDAASQGAPGRGSLCGWWEEEQPGEDEQTCEGEPPTRGQPSSTSQRTQRGRRKGSHLWTLSSEAEVWVAGAGEVVGG